MGVRVSVSTAETQRISAKPLRPCAFAVSMPTLTLTLTLTLTHNS